MSDWIHPTASTPREASYLAAAQAITAERDRYRQALMQIARGGIGEGAAVRLAVAALASASSRNEHGEDS